MNDFSKELKEALKWFKQLYPEGSHLKLVWKPEGSKEEPTLLGELKDNKIYVYVKDNIDEAIVTLFHEYLHYLTDDIGKPYLAICNKLLEAMNQIAYDVSDKAIDKLSRGLKQVYDIKKAHERRRDAHLRLAKLYASLWHISEHKKYAQFNYACMHAEEQKLEWWMPLAEEPLTT